MLLQAKLGAMLSNTLTGRGIEFRFYQVRQLCFVVHFGVSGNFRFLYIWG
jgi:hypothetical protein